MPIYEYECPKCGYKIEIWYKIEVLGTNELRLKCHKCLIPLIKVISLSNFILKGKGWMKDGYKI